MIKSIVLKRLEQEIDWYSKNSKSNQMWYKRLSILEIIFAALVPFAVVIKINVVFIAVFGLLIIIIQGLQGLFQFQNHWLSYRSTAENLKHEKYLWLAKAGPYSNESNSEKNLAERIESIISQENSKWIATNHKKKGGE